MRRPANRHIGYFYYFTAFILSALGLFFFHPYVYGALLASSVFVVLAIVGSSSKFTHQINLASTLKLWAAQGLGFLLWLIFVIFWFARFPYYGDLSCHFLHHLSLSLVLSAFILANGVNTLSDLMRRFQKPISTLLFFPNQKANLRIVIYGNIWFRRAIILTAFILPCFAIANFFPNVSTNGVLLFICLGLTVSFIKSPLYYHWLQVALKRFHLNYVLILLITLAAFLMFYAFLTWLLNPFIPNTSIDLSFVGNRAPLIVFWGYAICITVPLVFLLPKVIGSLNPKGLLIASLTNPFLWLIIALDFSGKLIPWLHHVPRTALLSLSAIVILSGFLYLNSRTFARLNTTFFMNQGADYQGKMPRLLVQNSIPMAFSLLAIFAFHAAIWLQIEFLSTGVYVLIVYFVSSCIYLFRLRKL